MAGVAELTSPCNLCEHMSRAWNFVVLANHNLWYGGVDVRLDVEGLYGNKLEALTFLDVFTHPPVVIIHGHLWNNPTALELIYNDAPLQCQTTNQANYVPLQRVFSIYLATLNLIYTLIQTYTPTHRYTITPPYLTAL